MTVRSRRLRHPIFRLAAGLLLTIGLCAGSANAQVVIVNPTGEGKDIAEYAEQAKRWTETIKQYQQELDHYKQQLINLTSLNFLRPPLDDKFVLREPGYGLEFTCPGAQASGIAGILEQIKSIAPTMNGNMAEEQLKVCARIVMAQNSQYNESVTMLKRLVQRNTEFEAIERQRGRVGTKQGALAANDNEVKRFTARNALEMSHWEAKMKAYDVYIAGLKDDQTLLAKRALEGDKGNLLGQVVQAAALKIALSK
ncbi:hypothetical protein [Xanthomonas campestris]|uniref:Uncharacterized protein n=2 Tax=Xanthomonas campestris TaxID=339 RepID=Q8P5P3_XANCP|nr:hypothetical protein [Xanthomonas campestris]AAM42563.1 hypothetical protein XCC3293 [Xanthomonas campestris pv. campestris str. ATCC 33913]MCC5049074.1 hypothetical protein [Xanthomonas campestris]MCC5053235.1 hypothetical protein [Xanthomonas campestris pv. aberrans]MCC5057405.1 hypothetical protein [Xanthomonas campestris]MCC5062188.1 hypothetical protein [Xanthomonas campestris]